MFIPAAVAAGVNTQMAKGTGNNAGWIMD